MEEDKNSNADHENSHEHKQNHESKDEHKTHDHENHEHKHHTHHKPEKEDSYLVWKIVSGLLFVLLLFVVFNPLSNVLPSAEDINDIANNIDTKTIIVDPELAAIPSTGTYGEDVPVVIVEYSDFQCPYCAVSAGVDNSLLRQFKQRDPTYEAAVPKLKEVYGDKIRVIYKHLPLSFHAQANIAALASECAREQDKFWAYHDVLFENPNALYANNLKQYAVQLELDTEQFNECLDSAKYQDKIDSDIAEASNWGVTGTPGFVIENSEVLSGAQGFSAFESIVESFLGTEKKERKIEEDAEFNINIIVSEDCAVCETESFKQNILSIFPTANVVTVDVNSKEGKEFRSTLNFESLPYYVFDSEIDKTANYRQLSPSLTKAGNYYVLNAERSNLLTQLIDPIDVSGYPVLGDENAPVTIVEFSDFECPYCGVSAGTKSSLYQQFIQRDPSYEALVPKLKEGLIKEGKVKLAFVDFPLSFHSNAQKASEAAQCARDQNKFWEYHDVLFDNQNALSASNLKKYAADMGLNTMDFNTCLDSDKHADYVQNGLKFGTSLGVSGTPGFFVNGIQLSGAVSYSEAEALINEILN